MICLHQAQHLIDLKRSPSTAYFQQQSNFNPFIQMQMATDRPFQAAANKDVIDFFSNLEEEQSTMLNPQTNRYAIFNISLTLISGTSTAYLSSRSQNSNPQNGLYQVGFRL
jgi:hypothetical protein